MGIRLWFSVATLFCSVSTLGAEFSYPLTSDTIQKYFDSHPTSSVEQFLGELPLSYTGSFVLLHHSKSLQQATYEKPRIIYFGPDARFLLAVGSVPSNPRFSIMEFAQFDEALGTYHYGEIDLSRRGSPKVDPDVAKCKICHGTPPRPIWGEYPKWAGAYSDEAGAISSEDSAGFAKFLLSRANDSRYSPLQFSGNDHSLYLTSRSYPYANTSFNHELGNTIAVGTLARMHQDKNFEANKWAVLGTSDALDCIGTEAWFDIAPKIKKWYTAGPAANYTPTTYPFVQAFRLMGIDPDLDLSIEDIVPSLGDPNLARTYGRWQTGAYRLDEAIAFDLLQETIATDSTLADQFTDVKATMKQIHSGILLTGEARAEAVKGDGGAYFNFFDVFDPLTRSKVRHEALCSYFASKLGN